MKIERYEKGEYYPLMFDYFINNLENSDLLIIVGYGFGDTQGDSVVHIGRLSFDSSSPRIKLWSDAKIRIRIPFKDKPCEWFKHGDGEYRKRKVWVTVGVDSNIKRIKVMKPIACP